MSSRQLLHLRDIIGLEFLSSDLRSILGLDLVKLTCVFVKLTCVFVKLTCVFVKLCMSDLD